MTTTEEVPARSLGTSAYRPPPVPAGVVSRAALVNRLRASRSASLVASFAPAGYGKTTLLKEWAARDGREFGWLTVDRTDNVPHTFLARLVLAFCAAGVPAEGALGLLDAKPTPVDAVVSWIANALHGYADPVVVVIDDVDALSTAACLDALGTLASAMPPGSQLALAGRSAPDLPFARLRAQGRLAEFGRDELRLASREARALLRLAGVHVPDAQVAELNERAEGWAAGLYLGVLSIRAQRGQGGPVGSTGPGSDLHAYFRREVVPHLSPDQLTFLRAIAVPERISGLLANAITGRADCFERLEELERTNLFLVPLDRTRSWFRLHHLFRELLLEELALREPPEAVAALNERAGAWFEQHGQIEAAMRHYADAGRRDSLVRLIESNAQRLWHAGMGELLDQWLERLDDPKLLRRHPALTVYAALVAALTGGAERAERLAAAAEQGDEVAMPDGSPTPDAWKAVLRAVLCRSGPERMRRDAELAVSKLPPDSVVRPAAFLALGVARLLGGSRDDGSAFAAAAEGARSSELPGLQSLALAESALVAAARGDWERAEEMAAAAKSAAEMGDVTQLQSLLAWVVGARLALRHGEWLEARRLLKRSMDLLPQATHAVPWLAVQARLELARAHIALADVTTAARLLDEVDALLAVRPALGVLAEQAAPLRADLAAGEEDDRRRAASLTPAELRLLPLLPTHLSFRAIADRLSISRNTVKTEAISIYRKLGVSSRSEAISRAFELGLAVPEPRSAPSTQLLEPGDGDGGGATAYGA